MNDQDRNRLRDAGTLFGKVEAAEAQTYVILGMKPQAVEEHLKNKPIVLNAYRYLQPAVRS